MEGFPEEPGQSSRPYIAANRASQEGADGTSSPPRSVGQRVKSWLGETLESIIPALLIVLLINAFLAQATRVEGQSMEPNLHNNERLIIEKISYRIRPPERGEIVVLRVPGKRSAPLIKRVVGLPGETVEIHDGNVFVDGQLLDESYIYQATYGTMAPQTVPDDHVFVLGDNRNASNDSRFFGMVSFDQIVGRAWLRYWPFDGLGLLGP